MSRGLSPDRAGDRTPCRCAFFPLFRQFDKGEKKQSVKRCLEYGIFSVPKADGVFPGNKKVGHGLSRHHTARNEGGKSIVPFENDALGVGGKSGQGNICDSLARGRTVWRAPGQGGNLPGLFFFPKKMIEEYEGSGNSGKHSQPGDDRQGARFQGNYRGNHALGKELDRIKKMKAFPAIADAYAAHRTK